jgi:hypothetical protein
MNWLFELHKTQPVAHAVGVLAFVCVVGMALESVRVKGIGLGTASVLFAGILVGHFGKAVDHHTLDFVKEFGLILFVFTIGLHPFLDDRTIARGNRQGCRDCGHHHEKNCLHGGNDLDKIVDPFASNNRAKRRSASQGSAIVQCNR